MSVICDENIRASKLIKLSPAVLTAAKVHFKTVLVPKFITETQRGSSFCIVESAELLDQPVLFMNLARKKNLVCDFLFDPVSDAITGLIFQWRVSKL